MNAPNQKPITPGRRRVIEPDMRELYEKSRDFSASVDRLIKATTGATKAFSLFIHAADESHATVMLTNVPRDISDQLLREYLKSLEAARAEELKQHPLDLTTDNKEGTKNG
jgi:hypothetical protein